MSKSLLEFAHVLRWCLKDNAYPLPKTELELGEWAAALDDKVDELKRYDPGALLELTSPTDEGDDLTRARKGFQRRLIQTPGVIASVGGASTDSTASIYVRALDYELAPETVSYFEKLRDQMLTPDDYELFEPIDVWRHARELALGFHQIWDPRPPDEWRLPRKKWHAFVRAVIGNSDRLDSESQVADACLAGLLPRGDLDAWLAVKDTFTPNPVPVWHDDLPLRRCLEWMKTPGIVWTEHAFFARRLAQMAGTKYYGRKGLAEDGEFVDDAPNARAIVVSSDANREGRNLQKKWARNLIVSPPGGSDWWQQLIGRTHRTGQLADEVIVDVFLGCREHAKAWRVARAGARAVRDTTGAEQKLLRATALDWPDEDELEARECGAEGARWRAGDGEFRIPEV